MWSEEFGVQVEILTDFFYSNLRIYVSPMIMALNKNKSRRDLHHNSTLHTPNSTLAIRSVPKKRNKGIS